VVARAERRVGSFRTGMSWAVVYPDSGGAVGSHCCSNEGGGITG
jgi:hypothetical protein